VARWPAAAAALARLRRRCGSRRSLSNSSSLGHMGKPVGVLVRTADELAAVRDGNPFPAARKVHRRDLSRRAAARSSAPGTSRTFYVCRRMSVLRAVTFRADTSIQNNSLFASMT
jgi:hypothetical protein